MLGPAPQAKGAPQPAFRSAAQNESEASAASAANPASLPILMATSGFPGRNRPGTSFRAPYAGTLDTLSLHHEGGIPQAQIAEKVSNQCMA